MKRTEVRDVVAHRRKLLIQAAQVLEADRCGPNLIATCGCTFVPWRHRSMNGHTSQGIGLIIECDQAHRLFEIAIQNDKTAQWEAHVYFAREDANNKLADIIKLLVQQRHDFVHNHLA